MTSGKLPTRELFVHDDPAAVGAWCHERIAPEALHLVPSAAARRLALRETLSRQSAAVGLTIATRGRLLAQLETRAGLMPLPSASPAVHRLAVTECATRAGVPLFDGDDDTPGGATAVITRLIRSLRLNDVTPAMYRDAGGDARVADAFALYESQRERLGLLDEADGVTRLLHKGVPSIPLILEDPSWPHATSLRLHEAAIEASPSCSVAVPRLGDDETPAVAAHLVSRGFMLIAERAADHRPTVRAIGGAGMQDEVELVARHMLALLRARPASRPSDILGIAPTSEYLAKLHEACERLGIPVASPRRVNVLDVGLVRALLDAFRLIGNPKADTAERGLALLATPYVGLSLARHDRLARNLVREGLGAMREWHRFATHETSRIFRDLATAVPRLYEETAGECAPRRFAAVVSALALKHSFLSTGRRLHLAAGDEHSVRLDQQGWDAVADAMRTLNEALAASNVTRLSADRWLTQLTELLGTVTVREHARATNGVHLTIAGAGLPATAHVFALGWRDGLVPRRVREEPFLPDAVKTALNAQGARFALAADRPAQDLERRARIVRAARGSLTISWPAFDGDGSPVLPSRYLDDLGVTAREVRQVGDVTWHSALASTRAERIARASVVARNRSAESLLDEVVHVRDTLSALTTSERRRWDRTVHAPQSIEMPAAMRERLVEESRVSSASQTHDLAHCLYEHFGKKRLQLAPLTAPQLDRRTIGTLSHAVLQQLVKEGFADGRLDSVMNDVWSDGEFNVYRSRPSAEFELEVLREQLAVVAKLERAYLAAPGYERSHAELAFGLPLEGRDPASRAEGFELSLPAGAVESVTLRGSIDRVDVYVRNGRRVAVAIDYKSGSGASNYKDMRGMADFQLPIYCEVLRSFGLEPVGAFYVSIRSGKRLGLIHKDYQDLAPSTDVQRKDEGEFQEFLTERIDALRGHLVRAARGEVEVRPRADDCGFCELRPVCRIGTFRAAGEPVDD